MIETSPLLNKDLLTLLSELESELDQTVEDCWKEEDFAEFLKSLTKGSDTLSAEIIKTGDYCYEKLQKDNEDLNKVLSHYIITFPWMEYAKSFLILWRDILFQAQKSQILFLENKVNESTLKKLKAYSKATVLVAAGELKSFFKNEFQRITELKKGREKHIDKWALQTNPYPTYRKQIEALPQQCHELLTQHQDLKKVSKTFAKISQLIEDTIVNYQDEIKQTKTLSQKVIHFLEEEEEEKIGKIPVFLEHLENEVEPALPIKAFTTKLEEILDEIATKTKVFVESKDGLLQFKEIYFHWSIRQWLESEILPVLYEIWELKANASNGLKMSFLNIRNRTVLLSNEIKEGKTTKVEKKDLSQPLNIFLKKADAWENSLSELHELSNNRLTESFGVFSVYHAEEEFLPVPLQSTINRFRLRQNKWLEWGQNRVKNVTNYVQKFKTTVEQEEKLSVSEKIVRFVQSRTSRADNQQYSSIFLTKGFIGESFWVGRKNELQHIENLIGQWKLGFRGAVILSGQRFSGKSSFGEVVANRFFPKKRIRLSPNTTINFQGRRFTCSYDLEDSLDFIKKHALQEQVLVWIDDLELWSDNQHPLGRNIRELQHYVDSYSGQIFFMVSMSNWLKSHLDKTYGFQKTFQGEINLDNMDIEEIREAILIRHGATHKVLVNGEGQEISPQLFQKITSKINKTVEGNIGEALHRWSFSTKLLDQDQVIFEPKFEYALPDFLNPDSAILLTTLMMEKRTNEYRLRKLFGKPFTEKYSSILQRLMSVGLLTRHLDGWLEINEVAANEVGKLMEQKQFLKFHA